MVAETVFPGLQSDDIVMLVLFIVGGVVLLAWIAFRHMADVLKTRQVQQTKREVAAYVAEGSIKPEDAVRILSADSSDLERQIGNAIAWGMINPKKAAELLKTAREGRVATPEPAARA